MDREKNVKNNINLTALSVSKDFKWFGIVACNNVGENYGREDMWDESFKATEQQFEYDYHAKPYVDEPLSNDNTELDLLRFNHQKVVHITTVMHPYREDRLTADVYL